MPPIFVGFAPMFSALAVAFAVCLVVIASLLFFVGCGCVVGGFLSLRTIATKRKGAPCWRVLSLCVVSVQNLVQLSKNSVAVALAFSSSFGLYSQTIQVASDGLPVLTLIFSGIMSI